MNLPKARIPGLLTDLYELTMAATYFDHEMFDRATFSLFVRNYPRRWQYFVSAGLSDVLDYLEKLRFSGADVDYLRGTRLFKPAFLDYLRELRFRGDVVAIPEGRLFFANEPVLEISAPMIEAQIVETFVINAIHFQSLIATKASRCVSASAGRKLVDFSLRRTHGADAGMKVARASYIGGFFGTSNVLAGKTYGIPISGTMAHSYVTSFEREIDAFRAFAGSFPKNAILLIDTYDTIEGAHKAAVVGKEMARRKEKLAGVRLDSGDLVALSKDVRKILRDAGLGDTSIFASGGLDEYEIQKLLAEGAEIDAFGVGTKMGVSADAPYLDIAYKLVEYAGKPVLKLSPEKATLAGKKQVVRFRGPGGWLERDVIALRGEKIEGGESLLRRFTESGKVVSRGKNTISSTLSNLQRLFLEEFSRLDDRYKSISEPAAEYPVELSEKLKKLQSETVERVCETESS
jgi:nicotinate phosphoribosyltransferase